MRKSKSGEVTNCRVVVNTCDWFWPNKLCLELTTSIEATSENPVELLCSYDALTKAFAPAKYNNTPGRKRKRTMAVDVDDELENELENELDDFSGEESAGDTEESAGDADGDDSQGVNEPVTPKGQEDTVCIADPC